MKLKHLQDILGIAGMLLGFGFAYIQRNSHEDIGVYGVILGILSRLFRSSINRPTLTDPVTTPRRFYRVVTAP